MTGIDARAWLLNELERRQFRRFCSGVETNFAERLDLLRESERTVAATLPSQPDVRRHSRSAIGSDWPARPAFRGERA